MTKGWSRAMHPYQKLPHGRKAGTQHISHAGEKCHRLWGGSSLSHPTPIDPKAATPPRTGTTFTLKLRASTQRTRLQICSALLGGCIYLPPPRRLNAEGGVSCWEELKEHWHTFAPGSQSGQPAAPATHESPRRAAGTATRRTPLCLCLPAADWKHPLLVPVGLKH